MVLPSLQYPAVQYLGISDHQTLRILAIKWNFKQVAYATQKPFFLQVKTPH